MFPIHTRAQNENGERTHNIGGVVAVIVVVVFEITKRTDGGPKYEVFKSMAKNKNEVLWNGRPSENTENFVC